MYNDTIDTTTLATAEQEVADLLYRILRENDPHRPTEEELEWDRRGCDQSAVELVGIVLKHFRPDLTGDHGRPKTHVPSVDLRRDILRQTMTIVTFQTDGTQLYTLQTKGLDTVYGLSELGIRNVAGVLIEEARHLLLTVAEYQIETGKQVRPGHTFGFGGVIDARLVSVEPGLMWLEVREHLKCQVCGKPLDRDTGHD